MRSIRSNCSCNIVPFRFRFAGEGWVRRAQELLHVGTALREGVGHRGSVRGELHRAPAIQGAAVLLFKRELHMGTLPRAAGYCGRKALQAAVRRDSPLFVWILQHVRSRRREAAPPARTRPQRRVPPRDGARQSGGEGGPRRMRPDERRASALQAEDERCARRTSRIA